MNLSYSSIFAESGLKDLYDLVKNCPTSANSEPMRVIFLKSKKSKERIKTYLSEGNVEKTMTAPIVAIIAYDSKFYDHLPKLFPHNPNIKKVLSLKEYKKEIIDKKRITTILTKIKKESLKKNIDPKITHRIWKNMIWSYINFEKRNFKKK